VRNPARGGGRWIDVAPERFPAWISSFTERHGGAAEVTADSAAITFTAPDGTVAECHPPFPPVLGLEGRLEDAGKTAGIIAAHAARDRTVGVFLFRLGGHAVGVFTGSPPALAVSKTGGRPVHGRSAAGGWSQHRFARRRENQAAAAATAAADTAVRVLGAYQLDAVVLGGDKRAFAALRDDPRLRPYLEIAADRFLTVPDPRLAVLQETPRTFRAIRIRLTEPPPAPNASP
jgi:hypothetical protein